MFAHDRDTDYLELCTIFLKKIFLFTEPKYHNVCHFTESMFGLTDLHVLTSVFARHMLRLNTLTPESHALF